MLLLVLVTVVTVAAADPNFPRVRPRPAHPALTMRRPITTTGNQGRDNPPIDNQPAASTE